MSPKRQYANVEDLDMSSIQERLKQKEKFDDARAEKTIEMYKKFLKMVQSNPDMIMVPNEDVDSAWHHHILDTERYAKDCDALFGKFLHHNPSFFGTDAFFEACEATNKTHDEMFNEDGNFLEMKIIQDGGPAPQSRPAWCGGMLKDSPEQSLKPGWCGGMLKETPELNLKPGWCGGMLKETPEQDLKPAWCGGMLKETPDLNLKPGWCGGMLKETPELNLKPSWCGGMLKDESEQATSTQ